MAPLLALRGLFVCLADLSASFIWPLFISGARSSCFASAVSWLSIQLAIPLICTFCCGKLFSGFHEQLVEDSVIKDEKNSVGSVRGVSFSWLM